MAAAKGQSGAEGAGGSAGLEVMPIDTVTLSDVLRSASPAATELPVPWRGRRSSRVS
jgi:hypothetical protein